MYAIRSYYEMVKQCHEKGILVMAMVSTLEDALSVNENA